MIKNFFLKYILYPNYIKHHLTHLKFDIFNFSILNNLNNYKYSFWILNLDSFLISLLLIIFFLFFFKYSINKIKYKKIPNKIQILLDIIILFVYNNVINIYGKKNKFVFSLSFSVFTLTLIMNLMGLFPIDFLPYIIKNIFNLNYFNYIPSSDINVTLSISLSVLILIFIYKFMKFGFSFIIKDFFLYPFNNKWLILFNILLEIINIFSKILSLSLRLFGNIYSGEIIFILIYFLIPLWLQWLFIIPLMNLHILISFLQSFIFMILTLIYIS